MSLPIRISLLALVVLGTTVLASAGVKVERQADGTIRMYNEGPGHRARRQATQLVPTPGDELESWIDEAARTTGLDPRLVRAVIQVESGYNRVAVSSKGALGLMQLMPETARQLGVADPFDARQNLGGGTRYLAGLMEQYRGDLTLALAGYNAGPAAVERYDGVPPYAETQHYVEKVMRLYRGDQSFKLGSSQTRRGRRTYLRRDANNRFVLSTTPPDGN